MRIGEFNQILQKAVSSDGTLQTSGEAIYGGQAYRINDFMNKARLVQALEEMDLLPGDASSETIELIIEHVDEDEYLPEIEEHQQIVALFTQINTRLPAYAEIAEAFSPDQQETTVNVKLPDNLQSLEELQNFNKRLDDIFKRFNIAGDFKVVGFDNGSEWYQILLDPNLYSFVMSAVSLALQAVDFRNARKGSDDLRLTKKTLDAKDPENKLTELKLLNGMVDEKITEDVTMAVEKLGTPDGREKPETISMIIGAVKELVKELDKGTEFHLSLNPPAYTEESPNGSITIDYKNIPKLDDKGPTKELESGAKSEPEDVVSSTED